MIRTSGHVIRHTARLLHFIMVVAIGLLVAASLLLASVAFRLSQGPINASWLSALHGDAFVINGTVGLSFDRIALAWEGFHGGVGVPIDFRLSNIIVTDTEGNRLLGARRALLSLSLGALLRGHLVPRRLELDDGLVTVTRRRGGSFDLGMTMEDASSTASERADQAATLRSIVADVAHPAEIDNPLGAPGLLSRARLRNFGLIVHDEQLGLTWQAAGSELELERRPSGAVVGSAHIPLALGDQHAEITLGINLPHGARGEIEATVSPVQPAMIAKLASGLPFLTRIKVPLSLHATMELDADLMPSSGHADVKVGTGRLDLGAGHVLVRDGVLALSATPDRLVIDDARLSLPLAKAETAVEVSLRGSVQRRAERLTAAVAVTLDHLDVAELAEVWPLGTGGGARPWIVQNVTAGTVPHASGQFVAESAIDLHDIVLTKASADLDADNVSVTWLDLVPPIERGQFHLHLVDPDKLSITASSAHQRISKGGADLLIPDAQMEITGLSVHDQDARIRLRAEGPVASALTLLREPRLHLLNKQTIELKAASGLTAATISLQFPLDNNLPAEAIVFQSSVHLADVRVDKIVAGRDLRDGDFDLTADKDGLGITGQGLLASIPITLNGTMDFNMGPPSQVLQRITVNGQPAVDQLTAAGIDLKDIVSSGEIPLTAVLTERRGGDGSVALNADLGRAALAFKPLAWSRPAGIPAVASAMLLMSHDRLTAIQHIAVEGKDVSLSASAEASEGVVRTVSIDHARFGNTDMRGSVTLPPGGPIAVAVSGRQIDLSSRLGAEHTPPEDATKAPSAKMSDWSLSARFEHALLANGERADAISLRSKINNGVLSQLDLTGSLAPGAAFSAQINAATGARRLAVDTADAGAFLRAAGLTRMIRYGRLTISGVYDDKLTTHPLGGTAQIDNARIVGVPALGKVLQGMTLYGMANLLSGPGIGASRIVAPFRYEQNRLQIVDGRLFSASLGLTAKGMIDFSTQRVSISGTIVPAYVFNSVLGYIPFVGKLFSPEVGGGLFAARFRVDGPFGDTTTSVNPLSVLTPGFLRNLFDVGSHS